MATQWSVPPPKRASFLMRAVPPLGQYSIPKFLELHEYLATASHWRVLWAILWTPFPGLVAALLLACLPVQPLREGATAFFYGHVFLLVVFATCGALLSTLVVTDVSPSVYSPRQVVLVSVCCGAMQVLITFLLTVSWRFPVPFSLVIGAFLWILSAVIAHLLVLGRQRCREPTLARAVKLYGVGLLLQVVQIVIYPAISVLFDHVDNRYHIAITLLFPAIKIAMKYSLKYVTRGLKDQHGVVVVAAVEICSSLYQAMIMQNAPSTVAMAVIMGLDLVQGFFSVKLFLDRPCHVPRHELTAEALQLVHTHRIRSIGTKPKVSLLRSASVTPYVQGPLPYDLPRTSTDSGAATRRRIVRQALQLTQLAETILLVEYFEVMIPLINCAFLVVAAQCRSAFFNPKLRVFFEHQSRLHHATTSILLYALLQGLSCVAMHVIMKRRYGLSATYHLAFVLEHHRAGIQGKLVAWLPVILHFTLAHYGTDFSLRFDFEQWEQW